MLPLGPLLEVGSKILDRVLPDPESAAKAKQELAALEQNGELAKIANDTKLFEIEQTNLTERLKADMGSDSWLSKNIRPMTLIAILAGYFTFAMMSAFEKNTNQAYVELLGQWGMLIMSFYFGGRTLEKIIDMKSKK
jgi:Holin of 3TMs, for gene-transfer release